MIPLILLHLEMALIIIIKVKKFYQDVVTHYIISYDVQDKWFHYFRNFHCFSFGADFVYEFHWPYGYTSGNQYTGIIF